MASLQTAVENLKKHGFDARAFETGEEAAAAALELIGSRSVGFGGSVTLRDLGIYPRLKAQGNTAWFAKGFSGDDVPDVYLRAQGAQVFLLSSNAVTENGYLVNIDGRGNRVAGLIFGHEEVIVIAGKNKLVENVEEGVKRIKGYAAGLNARRLGAKTPCAVDLKCHDCRSKDRICRSIVISECPPMGMKVSIFLVNEDLGY